jgi:protein-S-isoprenylcysteine O-methyltransferase Ste14
MIKIFKGINGMNLVGQGGKIIIFTFPYVALAIWLQYYYPEIVSLPQNLVAIKYIGYFWFVPGVLLWLNGLVQLLRDFPKGKLITSGAYGVCRNPIYSSVILFVLPAISLTTLTWVYFVVAIMLYMSVMIFITKEEVKLKQTFGKEYEDYRSRVSRIFPYVKPSRKYLTK